MSDPPFPYLGHGTWLPADDSLAVYVRFAEDPRDLPDPPFAMTVEGAGRERCWRAPATSLADPLILEPSDRGRALRLGLDARSVGAVEAAMVFADRDHWRALVARLDDWLLACHAVVPIALVVRPAQLSTDDGTRKALAHAALYDPTSWSAHHHASLARLPTLVPLLTEASDELVSEVVAFVGDAPLGPPQAPLVPLGFRVSGGDRLQRGLVALMTLATPQSVADLPPLRAATFLLRTDLAAHFAGFPDCAPVLADHLAAFASSAPDPEDWARLSSLIEYGLWPTRASSAVHAVLARFLVEHRGHFDGEVFGQLLDRLEAREGTSSSPHLRDAVATIAPWRHAMWRAEAAFTAGDARAAEDAYRDAVAQRDALPEAWTAIARLTLARGALDDAEHAVGRALELSSFDPRPILAQTELHLVRGDAAAALATIDPVTVRWGSHGRAHLLRGVALWALGKKPGARAAAKKAANHFPDWPTACADEPWFSLAAPLLPKS